MEKPVREKKYGRYRYKTLPGKLLFALCCLCAAMAAGSWLFWMIGYQPIAGLIYRTGVPEDQPAVSRRDGVPPGRLTDIAVNDESLFLLYERSAVVRAFSHDGEYQYAIIFPNPSGRSGELYASGTELYYRRVSGGSLLYQMHSGVFQAKYGEHEEGYKSLVALLNTNYVAEVCLYDYTEYRIEGQNVLRVHPDGTVDTLIDGPEIGGLLEPFTVWCSMMIFGVLAVAGWMASLRLDRRLSSKK